MPHRMEGIEFHSIIEKSDWMTLIILSVCVLVWSVWGKAGGFLEQKTSDIFHSHQRKSLFSVDTMSEFRLGTVMSAIYLITFSLYLHHVYVFFGGESTVAVFFFAMASLLVYHLVKLSIVRLLGFVFDVNAQTHQWTDSYMVLNHFVGLVFIPIVIGLTYGSEKVIFFLVNGSLFILLLYIIFVLIRFFNIFFSNISSIIYVFLYFCTLEILPLAILVKTIWLRMQDV